MKDIIITNARKLVEYFNERLSSKNVYDSYNVALLNEDSRMFKSFYNRTGVVPSEDILKKMKYSGIRKFTNLAKEFKGKNLAKKLE